MGKRVEVGEMVTLTGFAFDRGRKEDRTVTAVEIGPPEDFGSWRSDPFIRIAIEGVDGWFTKEGDHIPVGIGRKRFVRKHHHQKGQP